MTQSMTQTGDQKFCVVPDFTVYGNQPKVIAVAWNTRVQIEAQRNDRRRAIKRSTSVNGLTRVSRRPDVCAEDTWHGEKPFRSLRSWFSAAPKSPAAHWLAGQGYQRFPF